MAVNFIVGDRINLRSLVHSDVEGPYLGWLNDREVCAGNSHHVFPYTEKSASNYVDAVNQGNSSLVLAIVCKADDRHIGNVALQRINWIYRSAEFAILLGDKEYWGKGFGLEAARLIVKHGFFALNLHRIDCATFETNQGMRKLALAMGMKEEGTRRKAAFKNDEYLDIVEFGILREEFDGGAP